MGGRRLDQIDWKGEIASCVVMTGWSWAEAGEMDIPRFNRLAEAWYKVGPNAPYVTKKEAGPSIDSDAFPEDANPETDPLGFLMAHPELCRNG